MSILKDQMPQIVKISLQIDEYQKKIEKISKFTDLQFVHNEPWNHDIFYAYTFSEFEVKTLCQAYQNEINKLELELEQLVTPTYVYKEHSEIKHFSQEQHTKWTDKFTGKKK